MTKKLILALIGIFLFRAVLAFSVWHPDLNNHIDWGIRFFEYGPAKFFAPETNVWSFTWPNQPPGTMYMFAAMRKVFEATFAFFWFLNVKIPVFPSGVITFFESNLYPFFLQLPAILADFGIAFLIYRLVMDFTDLKNKKRMAILGSFVFLVNPVIWYNSSVWGQYDAVINFFGLLAFYLLLKKKLIAGTFAFALSLYIKASLLIFAPIFAIVALRQKYKVKTYITAVLVTLLILGVFTLPFSQGEPISWLINLYQKKIFVQQLHVITANAFNIWAAIAGIHERPDTLLLGPLAYKTWGTILYLASYIPALYLVYKKQDVKSIVWALAIVSFSSFMLLTNMHERYLYPLFAPLTVLAVTGSVGMFSYWAVSAISLLNLYHFWWVPRIEWLVSVMSAGDRFTPRALGLVNFGLFAHLYSKFLRLLPKPKV